MAKTALVIVAEGTEEMEAVITIDVLRRAGVLSWLQDASAVATPTWQVEVTVAGLAGAGPVRCSRAVVVVPDGPLETAAKSGPYDAVILPGGLGGAQNFSKSDLVRTVLAEQERSGRLIAAICAAPTALKAHGICQGRSLTSYPAFREELTQAGYAYSEERVVSDGNLVTSRGPGTAFEFALALVGRLCGAEQQEKTGSPLLLPA